MNYKERIVVLECWLVSFPNKPLSHILSEILPETQVPGFSVGTYMLQTANPHLTCSSALLYFIADFEERDMLLFYCLFTEQHVGLNNYTYFCKNASAFEFKRLHTYDY